jgi:ferredoxin
MGAPITMEMKRNWQVLEIDHTLCVACGLCTNACPAGAISVVFGKARVNPLACTGCGQCIEVCRTGAIHWRSEETRPKVPKRPYIRRGRFGWHRFCPRHDDSKGRAYDHKDYNELKERLRDMKKEADRILKRIESF